MIEYVPVETTVTKPSSIICEGKCLNFGTKNCPDRSCDGEPRQRYLRTCGVYKVPMDERQNAIDSRAEAAAKNDKISHPSHYISGRKYEPKDVIRDWGLNFNLGSAVKYISRAGRKDDIIQDLKKAQQFLQFEIDALEQEKGEQNYSVR